LRCGNGSKASVDIADIMSEEVTASSRNNFHSASGYS